MFSRFTNAIYNAVDALAPPLPLYEDFAWHWKSITRFFTGENASNSVPIEQTSIPGHLSEMLSILQQEENEIEVGNIGPCMEYIMQRKLLDTMCILASSDSPPGMKREMFDFITKLLNIVQPSLIPHVSISFPILNFIGQCGEVFAGPTECEEMEFLQCVCDKFNDNPHLLSCFFVTSSESISRRNSLSPNSIATKDSKEYALITSLIKMYQSPDNDISLKALGCIKYLCCHANDSIAITIAQLATLSEALCSNIVTVYKSISKSLKLHDLENPISDDEGATAISPEKRKYLCYLQQLIFLDSLVDEAHQIIGDHIALCFRENFLDAILYPSFVNSVDNDDLLFTTTLTSCSIRTIKSSKLMETFGVFLLDEGDFNFGEPTVHTMKAVLIERCQNYSDDNLSLALVNLQLFEELLFRPTKHILDIIVLRYLESRNYYDFTVSDSWLQFSDDDACSRYSDEFSNESTSSKLTPSYLNRVINAFIALVPDDLKSCESEEDFGYETYVKEAHSRLLKTLSITEHFDWPQSFPEKDKDNHLGAEDDSSSESQPEADCVHWTFYEGDFLRMLFDKLEQMLYQPSEINLQITSIISRLVLFANPFLHEYFLNPLIPYAPGVRSLFSILLKLSEDIQKKIPNIQGFKTKLKLTRNALLSDGNEYATFEESNILEALIVLEEFCKELAAITFVKYHTMP